MSQAYILKLSSPDIIQVKMCTQRIFLPFFGVIYEYPEHMEPIEDVAPSDLDTVKMITVKRDHTVQSIFKIWGDEPSVALFLTDLRKRCSETFTVDVMDVD